MKQYGLIGRKLGHSWSKRYFSEKFAREQIDAAYELYELPTIDAFAALLDRVPDLVGLNVTLPYKQAVMPLLDTLSEEAEAVGAVNTIRLDDGEKRGFNTDVYGFEASLLRFLGSHIPAQALILGTGGAAQAVAYVLGRQEIPFRLVSRKPESPEIWAYQDLNASTLSAYHLVVNTTPLGMYPNLDAAPAIPFDGLGREHYVFDLVYNPLETSFLRQAAARGAKTVNGLEMLELQAEGSWRIWNHVP